MEEDDEFISINEEKEEIINKDIEEDFLIEDIIIQEKGLFKIYIERKNKNELNKNKTNFDIIEQIQNEQLIKIQNNNFNNNINNFEQIKIILILIIIIL